MQAAPKSSGRFQPIEGALLDVRAAADFRPHDRRAQLPDPWSAAVTTPRPAPNETIIAAPFGNQPLEVEHRPPFARRAIAGELVIVLVRSAEGVERNHARLSAVTTCKLCRTGGNFAGVCEGGARKLVTPLRVVGLLCKRSQAFFSEQRTAGPIYRNQ